MQSELTDNDSEFGSRLSIARRRRHLSKPAMARRMVPHVADQCPDLDTLISYLKRWEAGKNGISERYRFACAKALDMDETQLFGQQNLPSPASPEALLPGTVDELGIFSDWDDMERRRLLLAALGMGAGALASPGPHGPLIDLALTSEPRDLAEWRLVASDHLHAIRTRPAAQVRDDLLVDLVSVRRQMTLPGAKVTDLQGVLAALSTLYANALSRLGDHGGGLRWFRTARHAADADGDPDLRLLVRGEEAGFGLYGQRDPATVLRLLDDADKIPGRWSSVWRAHHKLTRAKALSLLGRHEEAKTIMDSLATTAPDAPRGPIPTYWRADMIDFAESWVRAHAGDEAAADEARSRVLAFGPGLDYQYAANVRLHEALCTVTNGGIDTGARQAAGILAALPAGQHSHMITETGATILRLVPAEQQHRPAVREFRDVLASTSPRSAELTARG
jgi:transcriptional regulator with XRE-family HTH domain